MAKDSNTFPMVLAIRSDGSVDQAADLLERNLGTAAQRVSASLGGIGQAIRAVRREAEQAVVDPLGIRGSLAALSTSPVQKLFDTVTAGSMQAAAAQQAMRATFTASVNAQTQVALANSHLRRQHERGGVDMKRFSALCSSFKPRSVSPKPGDSGGARRGDHNHASVLPCLGESVILPNCSLPSA